VLVVGEQEVESRVAEQLGDTPDDAQAIAEYYWDKIYPLARSAEPA